MTRKEKETRKRRKAAQHTSPFKRVAAGVTIAVAAALVGLAIVYYVTKNDAIEYTALPETFQATPAEQNIDCDQLEALVSQASQEGQRLDVAAAERKAAIKENMSVIVYTKPNNELVAAASALRITEGGYFVTVAHAVEPLVKGEKKIGGTKVEAAFLIHLASGRAYAIKEFLYDKEKDLAVIHAPTGAQHSLIKGIVFRNGAAGLGERLEMLAANVGFDNRGLKYALIPRRGKVIDAEGIEGKFEPLKGTIAVQGMIPFGGASGAPVFDQDRRIVGVVSGHYGGEAYEKYEGTTVAPITGIEALAKKCDSSRPN